MTHEHTRSASALVISNVAIRMHEGLYCLNDLHRAAGGEKRHQPSNWLRLEQTCELIEEIERSSDLRNGENGHSSDLRSGDSGRCSDLSNGVVKLIQGGDPGLQGTYVCKELVYAYAMWISPKFHLAVIRAFDDFFLTLDASPAYACSVAGHPAARVCQPGTAEAQAASFERGFFMPDQWWPVRIPLRGSRFLGTGPGRSAQVASHLSARRWVAVVHRIPRA